MIAPIRKYAFLVYHRDYDHFLDDLGELGVLHIVEKQTELDKKTLDKLDQLKQVNEAISFLKNRDTEKKGTKTEEDGLELYKLITEKRNKLEVFSQRHVALIKEMLQAEPWGDFDRKTLDRLTEEGLTLKFYVISHKKFNPEWAEKHHVAVISHHQSQVHFVVVNKDGEEAFEPEEAEETKLPKRPISAVLSEKKQVEQRIRNFNEELDEFAGSALPHLEEAANRLETETDYKRAMLNTAEQADGKVKVLEGFVPMDKRKALEEYLEKNHILYLSHKPEPKDNPPVELRNGKFARLFEPIAKLFALPSYKELDLTPFFAPFFMLFFGFCLGDAGYGLIFIIAGFIIRPRLKPNLKPIVSLVQFLGVGTVIFGILTGTFFGMNLLQTDIQALESIKNFMLNSQQAFYLAIIIGVVQILFGIGVHAVNRTRQYGFKYALPQIGWLMLLPGMGLYFGFEGFKLAGNILMFGGIFLIIFWSDPKASIFGRIGKGLWDLYNITGVFGDVLSYIRLFALGVSSAILGFVINDISMTIKDGMPYVGPVLMVIFLLVGHTANIFISSLGAFVHPMRLTFVEFYKNAGFTGGGKAYKPFKNKLKN
ncbi:MAG: hypothetical protein K9G67_03200 [Bacteroidales bacterium]|nr:hypothetical protein [Bacteroidales bacterium]MCF8344950.1 hypothetical protein [Bacteroidales bacterium]MCF8352422.1 hypothetical protein [Bacteroidales bacterium]MCF8375337.1 hypothetical protein [Bacteroidales bacterium]MCF8400193.1 hypothetical protein [Bacteroidales bacterium]